MEQTTYNLKQLCQVAGVSERTVRYYIKEGLLLPPTGPKTSSKYSQNHVLRLQLIHLLKARFLPLREIKKLLENKSLIQLEQLAQNLLNTEITIERNNKEQNSMSENPEITKSPTFLPYLNIAGQTGKGSVNSVQASLGGNSEWKNQFPFPFPNNQPEINVKAPFIPVTYDSVDEDTEQENLWEHIQIETGIELHLERSIAVKNREVLEGLVKEIRRRLKK